MANGLANCGGLKIDNTTLKVNPSNHCLYVASGGGGTIDHDLLINKDKINQHPIESILDLRDELDFKQDKLSDLDLIGIDNAKNILTNGDGSKFFSDDGTYKSVSGVSDSHSLLTNLDYEKSGHTGFASSKEITDLVDGLKTEFSKSTILDNPNESEIRYAPNEYRTAISGLKFGGLLTLGSGGFGSTNDVDVVMPPFNNLAIRSNEDTEGGKRTVFYPNLRFTGGKTIIENIQFNKQLTVNMLENNTAYLTNINHDLQPLLINCPNGGYIEISNSTLLGVKITAPISGKLTVIVNQVRFGNYNVNNWDIPNDPTKVILVFYNCIGGMMNLPTQTNILGTGGNYRPSNYIRTINDPLTPDGISQNFKGIDTKLENYDTRFETDELSFSTLDSTVKNVIAGEYLGVTGTNLITLNKSEQGVLIDATELETKISQLGLPSGVTYLSGQTTINISENGNYIIFGDVNSLVISSTGDTMVHVFGTVISLVIPNTQSTISLHISDYKGLDLTSEMLAPLKAGSIIGKYHYGSIAL